MKLFTTLKLNIFILGISLLFSNTLSADISGVGIASTKEIAKKEALSDLSQSIKSEVRSTFQEITRVNGNDDEGTTKLTSNIKISSNLPILGVEFNNQFIDDSSKVIANLSAKKVNKLYTKKLKNLNHEIDANLLEIKKSKSSSIKLKLYENIFSLLKDYDRYESVATILDIKLEKRPIITKAEVQSEILKFSTKIDSINIATQILAKSFKQKNIFVYPPLMQNSTTVTQFGSYFQKKLKEKLRITSSLNNASYILLGEYIITKNSMILNYELLKVKTNEVVESKTINIKEKAYKNIEIKPKNIDFDALLNSGIITSSDLKVSLNSNRGSENLLFREGEDVELFVKLNKMGYIYIVGYTQTKDGTISYLLELSEGSGDYKFLKFINQDDASRWISLGEFTIEPPFGIESLQVIASNSKISTLPSVKYDKDSGYYEISKNIKKALSTTRGLKKKKSKKAQMSEAVMSFTTMKR
ncbi:MAG: DUF4384 domain-containing protein [Campylobacterota bacterium]|nr:DUF4384 domain-containing protein [Campylobacterota bacterium]